MMLYVYQFVILTLCAVEHVRGRSPQLCSFRKGDCIYNIRLEHDSGQCSKAQAYDPKRPASVPDIDRLQKDYVEKVEILEKYMKTTKTDLEARIKLLEHIVSRMGLDGPGIATGDKDVKKTKKFSVGPERTETQLLTEIHDEFTVLRKRLSTKTQLYLISERRLNDTVKRLVALQKNLVRSNKLLVSAEDELNSLKEDNFILKTQVKEKNLQNAKLTQDLTIAETDLNKTGTNLEKLQTKHESTQKNLDLQKENLNASLNLMNKAYRRYDELTKSYYKTRSELSRRETELMGCYTAKTSTFCGFEDDNICGFAQENNTDFFNWTRSKSGTPSGKTGPDRDHTCASRAGRFMFIEASSKAKGQNAILYSPRYRGLNQQCLEFYYHMFGNNIGTLNVYTRVYGNELSAVWRASGNQGNFWILARLHIPQYLARAGYQVAFEGITADGYRGDISIDDIKVTDGTCPQDTKVKPVIVDIKLPAKPTDRSNIKISKSEKRRRRKFLRKKNKLLNKIQKNRKA